MSDAPATVALVHGAGSGAWTWHRVVDELGRRGVEARAVDLPSHSASDNSVGPHDDAEFVRQVVAAIAGPVVLVGNSYGGFVISGAAVDVPNVVWLVYLAAFMPRPGESMDVIAEEAAVPGDEMGITFLDDGRMSFEPEADLRSCYQLAPADEVAFVRQHLGRPMSIGPPEQAAFDRVAWHTMPSTYVVCENDHALRPEAERAWARERATEFIELPADHCAQHSAPELVADILESVARAAVENRPS